MEELTALLVDDEDLARRGLKLRLAKHSNVRVIGECTNGREALQEIPKLSPDLVFLDIQMPGLDGFDVVRNMQSDAMPQVVFVTAYDQYAIQAFDVHAVDYILKPPDDEHLTRALDRARSNLSNQKAVEEKHRLLSVINDITGKGPMEMEQWLSNGSGEKSKKYPEKLAIKDSGNINLVRVEDIDWVDAAGDYMCVHAGESIHVMRITMKQLEAQLDPDLFQRVHRSTLVNMSRVEKISGHMNGEFQLILTCGTSLKMSRSYKDKIQRFLN